MATVTLTYNGRSSTARALIEMILSTGLFTKVTKPNKKTMAAINEAKNESSLPRVDTSSTDDFIESIMQ